MKQQFVILEQDAKDAVVADAAERGASMNDIVVGVIARHYEVDFEPTGRNPTPPGASPTVVLRMPPELWRRLHEDSFVRGKAKRLIVAELLARHYGLASAAAA